MYADESGEFLGGYWGSKGYASIFCFIDQFWIYQSSFLTLRLSGIKRKKWTNHFESQGVFTWHWETFPLKTIVKMDVYNNVDIDASSS